MALTFVIPGALKAFTGDIRAWITGGRFAPRAL